MKIKSEDGSIVFPSGTVRRNCDRAALMDGLADANVREVFANKDWRHFYFDPEPGIKANAIFEGDRLDRVFILMNIESDNRDQWTTELELERKAKHDAWLLAELGSPPYRYPWGRVDSDFDSKGCVSEIIITYAS